MTTLAAYLSPLALALPTLAGPPPASWPAMPSARTVAHVAPDHASPALGLRADDGAADLRVLDEAYRPQPRNQVRIERRVIIRISPSSPAQRERMMSALPRRPLPAGFAEVDHGDCVPIADIAGVQPVEGDKLLLFMNDRQVLSAALKRTCSARAFYSGFYIEPTADGNLCVSRDRLHSRAGMSCEIATIHRLVAVRD